MVNLHSKLSRAFFKYKLGEVKTGLKYLCNKELYRACLQSPLEHHNAASDATAIAEIVENMAYREAWEKFLVNQDQDEGHFVTIENCVYSLFGRKAYKKTNFLPTSARDLFGELGFAGLLQQ